MKQVPKLWWDLEDPNFVIVESDDDRYPVVAKFTYDPQVGGMWTPKLIEAMGHDEEPDFKPGCASPAIRQAEQLIKNINEGRISMKEAYLNYGAECHGYPL